jgi:TatD DNase family protein
VVDSHCHLDAMGVDIGQSLVDAAAVGVTRVVTVGDTLESSRWCADTATKHPLVVATVAVHPNEVGGIDESTWDGLAELAARPQVRAVGETGLDYFRTGEDGRDAQQRSFRWHLELAKALDRTLVIHDRDAHDDVLRIVDEVGAPERWVMHCFSGDAEFAQACLERGAYLSFAGTVTFKNAEPLREALQVAPLDRILVETDAPYLTPMPYRGRPNASYLVPLTMRSMAETRGDDLEELCRAVDANTDRAFGGTWG